TWLQRSRDLPLDISLHELDHSEDTLSITVGILSLLIGHAHRWKAINFSFSRGVPWVLQNTLQSNSLCVLESAEIISCDSDSFGFLENYLPSLEKAWGIIHGAPSLRKGKWDLHYLYHRIHSVPWNQLTSIDVAVSINALLALLPSCQNLVDLRFCDPEEGCRDIFYLPPELKSYTPPTSELDDQITLPHLRTLSMKVSQTPADPIIQRLTLPSLTSFSIIQYQNSDGPSLYDDLWSRSRCRLQRFSLTDYSEEAEAWLLRTLASPALESLVELTVDSTHGSMIGLVPFLTYRDGTTYLPRLQKLALAHCKAPPGAYIHMVRSRLSKTENSSVLRHIRIALYHRDQVERDDFRQLAAEGAIRVESI
ncbi:hypothetical protein DXG03_009136, partial [Asterophora parasitica]